jgi:hypothetical protein
LGVGYVLVEKNTPGPLGKSRQTLDQLTVKFDDAYLALYAVPGDVRETSANRAPAIVSHLMWGALLLAASGATVFFGVARLRDDKARNLPALD